MRSLILYLLAFLAITVVGGEGSKEPATSAKVIVTGSGNGFFEVGSAVSSDTYIVIQFDDKTSLIVQTPNTFSVNNSFKILAVEGTLTSTGDTSLIKLVDSKANRVPILIADKVTVVDEKNKESFPAAGQGRIEAIARKISIKVGSEKVEWAVQNSEGPIPLIFPKDRKPPEPESQERISGKVRIIEGQFLLEVTKTEPVKK